MNDRSRLSLRRKTPAIPNSRNSGSRGDQDAVPDFSIERRRVPVDAKIVETVLENGAITAVPTPIAYMKGVMDLRGQVIRS